ncbi:glycosyltransferase family 4 protein [Patiriisocius sp. Uisw_017]|jgi:UDP-N-acetylmuramyl pentapeptide phosphotransferase/UDP-N-acetylglucosamine-1-phosphate transferase|uniref:glycosyltransferase family 4 protein n=1 Tax=Patiriisocius sp. Uisw_017 TaxID=3230968 RepID=UPI0039E7399D
MNNIFYVAIASVIGSFILVTFLIPKISWIVRSRNLIDRPDQRSSHINSTPTMAGVSFFFTLIFMLILLKEWDVNAIGINLIASLGLLFAIGLKDDLVVSTPRAKIGGEIMAICFILFCNCVQVESLNGFLGIHEIPSFVSYVFIVLMMLTIINSYNMIDGIDGLASTIGIVIFSIYALIFYTLNQTFYFLLSLILIGVLLGYLRYNLSKINKIFMGDTGSLIIGFCIGFMSLKFLSLDASLLEAHSFKAQNSLVVIGAIFFIPLFDTLRVIGIRLINNKSPFYPDNNHIHHILINSGLSHFKASLFLCFLNLVLAVIFIFLSRLFSNFIMLGFYIISFIILLGIFHQLRKNIGQVNSFRHLIAAIKFFF